jgi:tetratricopeptide (TPR) repeat protein
MSKKLFISHSSQDNAIADVIYDGLRAAGFDEVWVDHRHGIEPGDQDWELAIREALGECDEVLYLMSQASLDSKWCKREISRADGLGKPIFVAKLEEIQRSNDRFMQIETSQYANFMTRSDEEMQIIIRALKGEHAPELPKPVTAQTITGVDTMRRHLEYLKNRFRGYDDTLAQVQSMLGDHVLQIVGPGGLGKSRLAAELAMNHSTGAIWYRCSETGQVADLEALLYEHLHLPADTTLSNVLAVLSEKKPLIVVDNAEVAIANPDLQHAYENLLQKIVGRNVSVVLTTRVVWTELKPRREYAPSALSIDIAAQIALDFATADNRVLSESDAHNLADKARLHPGLIEFSIGQLRERSLNSVLRQLSELTSRDVQAALYEMVGKTVEQMSKQADNGTDAETLLVRMPLLQATFPLDAIKAIAPDEMKEDIDQMEDALVTLQRWQFVRRDLITDRYSLGELVRETLGQPEEEVFWAYAEFYTARAGEIFDKPSEHWKDHEDELPNILTVGDALYLALRQLDPLAEIADEIDTVPVSLGLLFALNTEKFVTARPEFRRTTWLEMGMIAAIVLNQRKHAAFLTHQLGYLWSQLGDKRKALEYYEQELPLIREMGDLEAEAITLSNIGNAKLAQGHKEDALKYSMDALKVLPPSENQANEAMMLNNIGRALQEMGNHREALKYFNRALPLLEKFGPAGNTALVYNNIGGIWAKLKNFDKALESHDKALEVAQAHGEIIDIVNSHNGKGFVLKSLGKHTESLQEVQQAMEIAKDLEDPFLWFTLYQNAGVGYFELGQLENAIGYLQQSITIGREIEHPDFPLVNELLKIALRNRRLIESLPAERVSKLLQIYSDSGEKRLRRFLLDSGTPPGPLLEATIEFIKHRAG